jgi:hypothetical protein
VYWRVLERPIVCGKRDEDLAGGHLGGYRRNNAVKLRLGRMKRKM